MKQELIEDRNLGLENMMELSFFCFLFMLKVKTLFSFTCYGLSLTNYHGHHTSRIIGIQAKAGLLQLSITIIIFSALSPELHVLNLRQMLLHKHKKWWLIIQLIHLHFCPLIYNNTCNFWLLENDVVMFNCSCSILF